MSLYVLDTDILTLFQEDHPVIRDRVAAHAPEELAITVLTVEEQLSGWYTQLRRANTSDKLAWAYRRLANTVRCLSQLQIMDFDKPAIERYEELRKLKLKIGKMDLRIAATVLELGAALVTGNTQDFQRVPGLKIEDWMH